MNYSNGWFVEHMLQRRLYVVQWNGKKKSKETSVTLWLYDFFCQFEQYISSSANATYNKTYSRTTAIIFQRVVKTETKKAIRSTYLCTLVCIEFVVLTYFCSSLPGAFPSLPSTSTLVICAQIILQIITLLWDIYSCTQVPSTQYV